MFFLSIFSPLSSLICIGVTVYLSIDLEEDILGQLLSIYIIAPSLNVFFVILSVVPNIILFNRYKIFILEDANFQTDDTLTAGLMD